MRKNGTLAETSTETTGQLKGVQPSTSQIEEMIQTVKQMEELLKSIHCQLETLSEQNRQSIGTADINQ